MTTPQQVEAREGSFNHLIEVAKDLEVCTDGPLSHMFTATLNVLYAKEVDPETGIAIESQALDAYNSQNLWMANKISTQRDDIGMLYGVLKSDTSLQDVMRVANAIADMTEQEKQKSAVVIVNPPEMAELPREGVAGHVNATGMDTREGPGPEPHVPTGAAKGGVMPIEITNERIPGSGERFQTFHFSDPMARATSPLYAADHDWGTRVYRANNVFARALKEVAEKAGVKTFPSLEAYLESLQKKE